MGLSGLRFKTVFSTALLSMFTTTNCVFAHAVEKSFWEVRRDRARRHQAGGSMAERAPALQSSPQLVSTIPAVETSVLNISNHLKESLPPRFIEKRGDLLTALAHIPATLRGVSFPPDGPNDGPIVVHIHDVHGDGEAQRNIGLSVQRLVDAGMIGLVGLEGVSGPLPLDQFRTFHSRRAVRATADYLLREGEISGPIHAAFTCARDLPPFLGVENPTHYALNVDAYVRSAPRMETVKAELVQIKSRLETVKAKVYNADLLTLDKEVGGFRSGESPLGSYVETLSRARPDLPPSVTLFRKALSMEKSLDFTAVERERALLIEKLAVSLTEQQLEGLVSHSMAYRSGQTGYGQFYAHLADLCRTAGVSLKDLPAMEAYIRYILLADRIAAETLFNDLADLENKAYETLAKTSEERRLVKESKFNHLTTKLVEFSLTPREWAEYQAMKGGTDIGLASFEAFYREAHIRDGEMARSLLRAIQPGAKPSLLVTGGYHADGITRLLTKSGATVISLTPKIDKVDAGQGAAYLSVFTREKTPLDKLFSGEKLFLPQNPARPAIMRILAPALIALVMVLLEPARPVETPASAYTTLGGYGQLTSVSATHNHMTGNVLTPQGALRVDPTIEDESIARVDMTSAANETPASFGPILRTLLAAGIFLVFLGPLDIVHLVTDWPSHGSGLIGLGENFIHLVPMMAIGFPPVTPYVPAKHPPQDSRRLREVYRAYGNFLKFPESPKFRKIREALREQKGLNNYELRVLTDVMDELKRRRELHGIDIDGLTIFEQMEVLEPDNDINNFPYAKYEAMDLNEYNALLAKKADAYGSRFINSETGRHFPERIQHFQNKWRSFLEGKKEEKPNWENS